MILPNNKNIIPVAEQVDAQTSKTVRVVPTRGIAEGFAALLAYDPEADVDDNADGDGRGGRGASSPARSPGPCATRRCDVGPIAEGDWLGISRDGIDAVEPTLADAATALLDKLVDDEPRDRHHHRGRGRHAGRHPAHHRVARPSTDRDVTAEVHHGGQPLYPYLFGIE